MKIISVALYVSPRERPLNEEEQEVRRLAYALKVASSEAICKAADALAPLVESATDVCATVVLMPVPSSANCLTANMRLAEAVAHRMWLLNRERKVVVKVTVARRHPVESSCLRRRAGKPGLTVEEHSMIRIAGPLTATNRVFYFVDNMLATGRTLEACRQALGFGDAVVYAEQGRKRR